MKHIMRKRKETERMKRSAGAPKNLHILQPGSIVVLSFTCEAFFVLSAFFFQVSKTTHLLKVQQSEPPLHVYIKLEKMHMLRVLFIAGQCF